MPNEGIHAAFEVLGLSSDATPQQVRDAFHDLAQVWQPDRFAHNPRLRDQAEAKVKGLNQARAVLQEYFASNEQPVSEAATGGPSGESAGFRKGKGAGRSTTFASTTRGTANHSVDEAITTIRCPHCAEVSRVNLPDGWIVRPLAVRCPRCRKNFEPIPISDPPASDVSRECVVGSANVPWHKDPILKYAWRIPTAILAVFFLFISRHLISHVLRQILLYITNAAIYVFENAGFLFFYFILLPIGVVSLLMLVVFAVRQEARRQALATRCPSCDRLSALRCVGENIVSQTPRPKTVTRTSSGAAFLDGQLIPTFRSERVQIIVYDVVFQDVYKCRFCHKQSMSGPLQREVQP